MIIMTIVIIVIIVIIVTIVIIVINVIIIVMTTMNVLSQGQIDHQLRPIRASPVRAWWPACHVIMMNVNAMSCDECHHDVIMMNVINIAVMNVIDFIMISAVIRIIVFTFDKVFPQIIQSFEAKQHSDQRPVNRTRNPIFF